MSDNLDISVNPFVVPDYNDVADVWPSQGMPCEVQDCKSPVFTTYNKYKLHWNKFHVTLVNVFTCPLDGCEVKFNEKWLINRHLKRDHRMSEENVKLQVVPPVKTHNMNYKNPGNIKLRRHVKVNAAAREKARLDRERYAEEHKVSFDNLPRSNSKSAVCRGQSLVFDFSKPGQEIQGKITKW